MRGASMSSLKRYFMVIGLVGFSLIQATILDAESFDVGIVKKGTVLIQRGPTIFAETLIEFIPDSPDRHEGGYGYATNHGRVVTSEAYLFQGLSRADEIPSKITGHLTIRPIPKNELEVHDKWDRAGNIILVPENGSEIELIKFVTAYGGATEHEVDLTHLASVLRDKCTMRAFIDTWVSPGWTISLSFEYEWEDTGSGEPRADWAHGLIYEPGFDQDTEQAGGIDAHVRIPEDLTRVMLYYNVSGHCTDGRGADEFESKDNVITVDGVVVHRYRPWRDDCRDFRAINPYCKRWSDGSWSSDYDRSGWCPGDVVDPLVLDLTDHLTPGDHKLNVQIDGVRPKDDEGHKGYWRVSAYLVGYR